MGGKRKNRKKNKGNKKEDESKEDNAEESEDQKENEGTKKNEDELKEESQKKEESNDNEEEKKTLAKNKLIDEKISKIDSSMFKVEKESQNIKNSQNLNKRQIDQIKNVSIRRRGNGDSTSGRGNRGSRRK